MMDFSYVIDLEKVYKSGRARSFQATHQHRQDIIAMFDLLAMKSFFAQFQVEKDSEDSYRICGSINAVITQPSIVSFEPVTTSISKPFILTLSPCSIQHGESFKVCSDKISDVFISGCYDIGNFALEYLSLALPEQPLLPQESASDADLCLAEGSFPSVLEITSDTLELKNSYEINEKPPTNQVLHAFTVKNALEPSPFKDLCHLFDLHPPTSNDSDSSKKQLDPINSLELYHHISNSSETPQTQADPTNSVNLHRQPPSSPEAIAPHSETTVACVIDIPGGMSITIRSIVIDQLAHMLRKLMA